MRDGDSGRCMPREKIQIDNLGEDASEIEKILPIDVARIPPHLKRAGLCASRHGGYELKISGTETSKRLSLDKKEQDGSMVTLILEKSGARSYSIRGRARAVYEACALADFYLPHLEDSAPFYEQFHRAVLGSPIERLGDVAEELNQRTSPGGDLWARGIPYFPMPVLCTTDVFKYYNFKEFKSQHVKQKFLCKVSVDDPVPQEPANPQKLQRRVEKKVGEHFQEVRAFVGALFAERPVWPIKVLEKRAMRSLPSLLAGKRWSNIKHALPLVAYSYSTGPWKKLWTRFGYDPRKDPESYKYQTYIWKNVTRAFALMDRRDVMEEIERRKDLLVNPSFERRRGFLTEHFFAHFNRKFSEVHVSVEGPRGGKLVELEDDLVFETLD